MEEERMKGMIAEMLKQAVKDLEGSNRSNRSSAIKFFQSEWGRWLMEYMGMTGMPKELAQRIAAAKRQHRTEVY